MMTYDKFEEVEKDIIEKAPPIIYKYRNWKDDYHKNLLIKKELFMAPPSWLNDPFDCRIYENYLKFVNTPDLKEKYIVESLFKNSEYLKDNNITELKAREILTERLNDTLYFQIRSEVIAQELLEKEILFQTDLTRLIGKRPFAKETTYEAFTESETVAETVVNSIEEVAIAEPSNAGAINLEKKESI